jgi:RelA/SpoT family (p)ppGpp synthetase
VRARISNTATPPTGDSATTAPDQEVAENMDEGETAGLRALLAMCSAYMPADDLTLVRSAYAVAARAHKQMKRVSGEPFIEHPLAVARILASLAMDASGIAAALLHDTVEDTSRTLAEIEEWFGPVIATIVDGVTKFQVVGRGAPGDGVTDEPARRPTPDQRLRQQQETVQKLVVAMMRDPRVVLLKLADRLHNLRTMAAMSPEQRAAKSRETMEIYVPLAGGIGLQVFKSELEDLAFSYQEPQEFERVVRLLAQEAEAHTDWALRVCERVRVKLREAGIVAAVNWRLKRPYRAYVETRKTGMRETDLHDIIAFRVIVNTQLECYRAMGLVHELWHPLDRIRDYVATPKVNGYRSLHTAVFALDERKAQFHIRTHEMHRQVQHGVAAHWLERAARGEPVDAALRLAMEDLPGWVAQLDDWHRELRLTADEFVDTLKRDVFDDQVFVFTPQGDVIDLPAGSTPLDFAYRIHTGLGDHFGGARVQTLAAGGMPTMRTAGYDYRLKSGDVVTIVKEESPQARQEWLSATRTRNAKEKVVRALRAVAQSAAAAQSWTYAEPSAESEPEPSEPALHPSGQPAVLRLGRCCYPCPGDKIIGFPGRQHQVTIHRRCCSIVRNALAKRRPQAPEDAGIALDWRALPDMRYAMVVAVRGQDHAGLLHDLAQCLKTMQLNLVGSSAKAIRDRDKALVTLICEFAPTDRPERVFARLKAIPGVLQVERDYHKGCGDARSLGTTSAKPRSGD